MEQFPESKFLLVGDSGEQGGSRGIDLLLGPLFIP